MQYYYLNWPDKSSSHQLDCVETALLYILPNITQISFTTTTKRNCGRQSVRCHRVFARKSGRDQGEFRIRRWRRGRARPPAFSEDGGPSAAGSSLEHLELCHGKAFAKLVISTWPFYTRGEIVGSSHFDSFDSIGGAALRRSCSLKSHYSAALRRCQSGLRSASSSREKNHTQAHGHSLHPALSCCDRSARRRSRNYSDGDRAGNILF